MYFLSVLFIVKCHSLKKCIDFWIYCGEIYWILAEVDESVAFTSGKTTKFQISAKSCLISWGYWQFQISESIYGVFGNKDMKHFKEAKERNALKYKMVRILSDLNAIKTVCIICSARGFRKLLYFHLKSKVYVLLKGWDQKIIENFKNYRYRWKYHKRNFAKYQYL